MSGLSERVPAPVPDFVEPPQLCNMTEEQQAEFLMAIRARRMVAVQYHEQVKQERAANVKAELDRKFELIEKRLQSCITKIDTELEKVEGYFGRIRALRLEVM